MSEDPRIAQLRALCDAADPTDTNYSFSIDPDDIRAILNGTPSRMSEWIVLNTMEAEAAADALSTVSSMRVRAATTEDRADWVLEGRLRDFVDDYRNRQ